VSRDLRPITNRSDTPIWYYKIPAMAYRMSKAALNMLAVCNYAELKGKGEGLKVCGYEFSGEKGFEERIRNGPRMRGEVLECW